MSVAFILAFAAAANSNVSTHETRLLVRDYGQCVVKRQRRSASEALLANADNTTLKRDYPKLIEPDCVRTVPGQRVQVKFEGDQYRYALADALVRTELASVPAPSLDSVPRLDHREPTEPMRVDRKGKALSERRYQEAMRRYEQAKAFSLLSLYGECVVRVDPTAARALLLTDPESPAEKAQFAAMQPALSTCVREGETISLGKLALRGTIAINYYRLAKTALGTRTAEVAK